MKNVAVFGDSLTWGKSDRENGGWVNLLRKYLEENSLVWGVYNLGVDGDTSKGVVARFEDEIKIREIDIVIFAIGINDSLYRKVKENRETSLEEYKTNIQRLIELSNKSEKKTVFIGLTKVDESCTQPLSYSSSGKCYDNESILEYNSALKTIVEANTLPFIEVFDVLVESDLADGAHPGRDGHQKLYERIKNEFMKLKLLP